MTTIRQHYRIVNPSSLEDLANQLNTILVHISERLDEMQGYRGTPQFQADVDLDGHNLLNVGTITYA